MAIAWDANSSSGAQGTSTSYSFNHTCTGSNLILFVGVAVRQGSFYNASAITYNGVSMTKIRHDDNGAGNSRGSDLFYLLNPATGTNSIAVTISGSGGSFSNSDAHGVSFTGAQQSGVPDSQGGGGGTATSSPSKSTTTVADNSWIVAMLCTGFDDGVATPTSPLVLSSKTAAVGSHTGALGYQGPKTPAGAQASAWTTTSDSYCMSVASFAPAVASTVKTLAALGVG